MDCFKKLFGGGKVADIIPIKPIENVSPIELKPVIAKILGIDVSHFEPALDWNKAKSGGVKFMYTKATEGVAHLDSMLKAHISSARSAGVLAGAYHFFHASMDAKAQASFYLKSIEGMIFDLPHCLDWESGSADGVASAVQKMKARTWLDIVEKATGKVPVIYGGESFLRELVLDSNFARYPLWLAHYGVSEDKIHIPKPWSKYTIWQWTDAGVVPGLAGGRHVDCNYFQGSLIELQSLGGHSV